MLNTRLTLRVFGRTDFLLLAHLRTRMYSDSKEFSPFFSFLIYDRIIYMEKIAVLLAMTTLS